MGTIAPIEIASHQGLDDCTTDQTLRISTWLYSAVMSAALMAMLTITVRQLVRLGTCWYVAALHSLLFIVGLLEPNCLLADCSSDRLYKGGGIDGFRLIASVVV